MKAIIQSSGLFLMLFLILACRPETVAAQAQDPRIALFDAYNRASTGEEFEPLLSGVMGRQYAAIAAKGKEQQLVDSLKSQQLAKYTPRIVEIDANTSFLVLDDVQAASGKPQESVAYMLSKNDGQKWTIANRTLAAGITKTLWTSSFSPARFNQPSKCSAGGKDIDARSVLAFREKDTIAIHLYPFEISEADLEYWKKVNLEPMKAETLAASHFGLGHDSPSCSVTLKLDGNNQVVLFNIGMQYPAGALSQKGAAQNMQAGLSASLSTVWQPPRSDISRLDVGKDGIAFSSVGKSAANGASWNVNVNVPILEKGL